MRCIEQSGVLSGQSRMEGQSRDVSWQRANKLTFEGKDKLSLKSLHETSAEWCNSSEINEILIPWLKRRKTNMHVFRLLNICDLWCISTIQLRYATYTQSKWLHLGIIITFSSGGKATDWWKRSLGAVERWNWKKYIESIWGCELKIEMTALHRGSLLFISVIIIKTSFRRGERVIVQVVRTKKMYSEQRKVALSSHSILHFDHVIHLEPS